MRPEHLRSYRWFGPQTLRAFGHRSRAEANRAARKISPAPVIAIINTWSEINPCHLHLRERAESVKKGVWQAGGFPVEIPAFSIIEILRSPAPCSTGTCWRWIPKNRCAACLSMARC